MAGVFGHFTASLSQRILRLTEQASLLLSTETAENFLSFFYLIGYPAKKQN